jgi:hypothetical protein
MPSSYQVVLWKQESFVVLRQIEFFRNLLEHPWRLGTTGARCANINKASKM